MYIVWLLFYAIGRFLFVSILIIVDLLFIAFFCSVLSKEATDYYFSPFPKHSPIFIKVFSVPQRMVEYFCMLPVVRYCCGTWRHPSIVHR